MLLLGVGFLQQGAPELIVGGGVKHDEFISHRRQPVVHHDVQPFVVLPELRERQSMSQNTCNAVRPLPTAHYLLSTTCKGSGKFCLGTL